VCFNWGVLVVQGQQGRSHLVCHDVKDIGLLGGHDEYLPLNQVFIMATKKPNILYIMADQMAAPLLSLHDKKS
jgi:hypothetical protein